MYGMFGSKQGTPARCADGVDIVVVEDETVPDNDNNKITKYKKDKWTKKHKKDNNRDKSHLYVWDVCQ